jgi:iron complex outermembrane receptor protein
MSFKPKKLTVAVMMALGSVSLAHAQTATTEKTVVTGSNIKRIDAETVAPVDIITRDQIERTGLPTIGEVLRNIPANTGGSFNESFSNSFAPGASGISLRGLGQKTTLVLINGRRTSGYGFAQNIQDTFVDLNSIPSSAVERIEILKDGASAIYGSDAIAGVVNVILRRDFRGVEVAGDVGWYDGKGDYRFSITGGFGDLARDRFNVFGVFDYYKRDELLMTDTDFGSSRDKRGEKGGQNFQSITGGIWRNAVGTANGSFTTGNTARAVADCPDVISAATAVEIGLLAETSALNTVGNTFCRRDLNSELSALPGTERLGFLGRGTFDISSNLQAYGEVGLSRIDTEQTFTYPFFNTTALRQTPAGLAPFTFNVAFAPGVAGNPLGVNALYTGPFYELGTRTSSIRSDTGRFLAGLKYTFGGFDGDSAIGYSKNDLESIAHNRLSKDAIAQAFGVTTAVQPPIPLSTSATYNLNNFNSNSAAARAALVVDSPRRSESELKFIDTKLSTEFGSLPGGPIGVALGAEYRDEKLTDTPDPFAATGGILGQGIVAVNGKRDNTALFAEFALPLTRQLEAQAAVRYDHYSDFGSATTPKLGLKYKISPALLVRANWGRGFRAPSLPEITPSVATFFSQINDPVTGQNGVQISGVFAGNPNLKPEKSVSTTVGMVFEPSPDFNIGVNWYQIDWRDQVFGDCCQAAVNAGGPNVVRDPSTGQIVTVFSGYINLNSTITRGYDIDTKYSIGTRYGRWTGRLNATYVDDYKVDGVQYAGTNADGTRTIPRIKAVASLDWDMGPWSVTGRWNYTHHFWQQLLGAAFFTERDPRLQNGVYPEKAPRHYTYDIFGRYSFSKNLSINASVINITDEKPPYDPGYSATSLYDFSLYDIRGRQYRLGLKYAL